MVENGPKIDQFIVDEKTQMLMMYKRMAIGSVIKLIKKSDREKKAPGHIRCWADDMEKTMQQYGIKYHEFLESICPSDYLQH